MENSKYVNFNDMVTKYLKLDPHLTLGVRVKQKGKDTWVHSEDATVLVDRITNIITDEMDKLCK